MGGSVTGAGDDGATELRELGSHLRAVAHDVNGSMAAVTLMVATMAPLIDRLERLLVLDPEGRRAVQELRVLRGHLDTVQADVIERVLGLGQLGRSLQER